MPNFPSPGNKCLELLHNQPRRAAQLQGGAGGHPKPVRHVDHELRLLSVAIRNLPGIRWGGSSAPDHGILRLATLQEHELQRIHTGLHSRRPGPAPSAQDPVGSLQQLHPFPMVLVLQQPAELDGERCQLAQRHPVVAVQHRLLAAPRPQVKSSHGIHPFVVL